MHYFIAILLSLPWIVPPLVTYFRLRHSRSLDDESVIPLANPPLVSVIVPARNEEACLAACLESLAAQTGIPYKIIVVDDDSTDRTAEIAHAFATRKPETPGRNDHARDEHERDDHTREGTASAVPQDPPSDDSGFSPAVCVIPAGPLPENWTGKNNAMSAGAKAAHTNTKAKWLLFTDADTVHQPGSLARAVAEAEQHGAALLSYSPQQEVHGFWEKAVMPVIFAELAATYPPQAVNDPASPMAAANGQYLMISREAYDAVGGHTKIADDLLEDVAIARLVPENTKIASRNRRRARRRGRAGPAGETVIGGHPVLK